jgi:DNA-binding response OmpR family regulator
MMTAFNWHQQDRRMQPARPVVLVFEDYPVTRGLLQDVLESSGYAVEAAADGASALARIHGSEIDIVLLDQMLPLVHGLELCRQLRGASRDVYLPVIMLTALEGESHRRAAVAAGVDVYLTKPFDVDELLYAVGRWTETCRRLKASRQPSAAPRAGHGDPGRSTVKERLVKLLAGGRYGGRR